MCTVLIVDDCQETLEAIAAMLEEADHQIVCTTEADRAVKICQEIDFDLVLCDLVLSEQSSQDSSLLVGLNLISKLVSAFEALPVIVMSGRLEDEQLRRLLHLGVRGALAKPFTSERLLAEIDQCLANREGSDLH